MLELKKPYTDYKKILDELLVGSGVVLIKEVFSMDHYCLYFGLPDI